MSKDNAKLLQILFKNTGSTTALLEAIAGEDIDVEIIQENEIQDRRLSSLFNWGCQLILRVTILKNKKHNLSYNIVIYDPNKLNMFKESFAKLDYPIGKLLEDIDYQRKVQYSGWKNKKNLSKYFNFEDLINLDKMDYPVKEYLHIHDGQVLFYISEIYDIETISKIFIQK